jgi:hypothetical protein
MLEVTETQGRDLVLSMQKIGEVEDRKVVAVGEMAAAQLATSRYETRIFLTTNEASSTLCIASPASSPEPLHPESPPCNKYRRHIPLQRDLPVLVGLPMESTLPRTRMQSWTTTF